ncbi:MAG TPA: PilN domain-containing protein [Tepidisphaeraceae bacterium]|jgi:Tfp pilus assembly protein PilN|nr:PilN domain-containing protein [Tepidisphaeraceae bacterium]
MPDLELLPDWYVKLRRVRRRLAIGAAVAAASLSGLFAAGAMLQRGIAAAETRSVAISAKLSVAQADLENLRHVARLRDATLAGHAQLAALAGHVPVSWLLAEFDRAAPPRVSLTELNLDPSEPTTGPSDPAELPGSSHIILRGLAASDAEVAALQAALGRVPGVSAVSIGNAKDLAVAGRVMRAFEIGFELASQPDARAGAVAGVSQ